MGRACPRQRRRRGDDADLSTPAADSPRLLRKGPDTDAQDDATRTTAVERALAGARAETLHRLDQLEGTFAEIVAASAGSNADDEHDPEGATIAYERSQVDALVRQAQAQLAEIDSAAARVAEGRYGVCERCGRPIATERLEARPMARTCVPCADA